MTDRMVIVTIDTITNLFKDYCSPGDIPQDAQPLQLKLKPTEMGRLAIVMESPEWKKGLTPLEVKFDIRRIYSVGK
jgi:hypothetical protein